MTDEPTTQEPAAQNDPAPEGNDAPAPAADASDAPQGGEPEGGKPDDNEGRQPTKDLLFDEGDDDKPDDEGKKKEEGEQDKGDEGAPDAVDVSSLEIPEDMPIPEELKGDLDQLMKDLTDASISPQEKAQKMIDAHVKSQHHMIDNWEKTKKTWQDEVMSDADIGGDKFKDVQKSVNKLIKETALDVNNGGSEELLKEFHDDLTMMGLGNKRSFIKFMNVLTRRFETGEDSQGDSQGAGRSGQKSLAERLYGQDGRGRS